MTEKSGWGTSAALSMGLVGEVVTMGRVAPSVRRNYQSLFQAGAMEPRMSFLVILEVPHRDNANASESTRISIDAIHRWRRQLHRDPNWRAHRVSAQPRSGALDAQQESDLAEALRVGHVLPDFDRSPAIVNRLALAMQADSLASQSNPLRDVPRGDFDYSPNDILQSRRFRANVHWRAGFLKRAGLSVRRSHLQR
jgi:hypothetical protein